MLALMFYISILDSLYNKELIKYMISIYGEVVFANYRQTNVVGY